MSVAASWICQWTPLRHTRAIGAWPSRRRLCNDLLHRPIREYSNHLRERGPRCHTPSNSQRVDSVKAIRKFHSTLDVQYSQPQNEDERRGGRTDEKGWNYLRKEENRDLPLPPFMRPNPRPRDKVRAIQERRHNLKKEEEQDYGRVLRGGNRKTLKQKSAASPFSTALAMNPYARALATPVRQERFSNNRQPQSCMVELHLVDFAEEQSDERLELFPASLVEEAIPKQMPPEKLTRDQQLAKQAVRKSDELWSNPRGSGSYLLNHRDAFNFVSGNPNKRIRSMVLSLSLMERRERKERKSARIGWKSNMSALVRHHMQTIVGRRLRFLLAKKDAEAPGLIQAIPGSKWRERLDDIPNVGCVLRLKHPSEDDKRVMDVRVDIILGDKEAAREGGATEAAVMDSITEEKSNLDHTAPSEQPSASRNSSTSIETSSTPIDDGDNSAAALSSEGELASDDLEERYPGTNDGGLVQPNPTTVVKGTGWWQSEDGFLRDLDPLPPPAKPSKLYFSTMEYRNRRVPSYNLLDLLGEEATSRLIRQTAYAESELVALANHPGTVGIQLALLRLAAFVAQKEEPTY